MAVSRKLLESVLVASFTLATFLLEFRREYKEDETGGGGGGGGGGTKSPVPTVTFNTRPPSTFHLFLLALIFAFSFSLFALLIHYSSSSDHNNTTSTTAANNNKSSGYSHQNIVVNLFGCTSLSNQPNQNVEDTSATREVEGD